MLGQSQYNSITAGISSIVVFGTWAVITIITILLEISWRFTHNVHAMGSLLVCGIAFIYVTIAYVMSRRFHYRVAAYLLVLLYLLIAGGIAWSWGINTPINLLIFGLAIVLAGILLTARCALGVAVVSELSLLGVQTAVTFKWDTPDTSWTGSQSSFGDVLAYCTVFTMLALVSWLYTREMERSLAHAERAEAALQQQKAVLKRQVKARMKDLRQVQLGEMRQMYHFAELGQLGVTLLHDLANHLTVLTLEIEGMEDRQHPEELARAQQVTQYLSDIVDTTRKRLHGSTLKQSFDLVARTSETIAFLDYKSTMMNVSIDWQPPAHAWRYTGDSNSFSQVVAILTSNAIDAYSGTTALPSEGRRVAVTMQRDDTYISIRITDWGKGITKNQRKHLFKSYYSTKKSGLGLGLYIAKQTVEMEFAGTISLSSQNDRTEFIIKLPVRNG